MDVRDPAERERDRESDSGRCTDSREAAYSESSSTQDQITAASFV